ncbi:hypothetical protein GW17_00021253 [Ensete ventricosum]|nr:hypothetical protein GW17_00021253 [Ensete ventricosum]
MVPVPTKCRHTGMDRYVNPCFQSYLMLIWVDQSYARSYSIKFQKPLPELLREYDMPIGLFPQDATHYEFIEETGKLTVYIPSICEVGYRDSSVLRFLTIVTGYLEKGKLVDIEGIKTKVLIWAKVNSIATEGSKVHFTTGMKKTRSRDAYEVLRGGITVDKF